MSVLQIEHLSETYTIRKRQIGLFAFLKNLFRPELQQIPALTDLSFTLEAGEICGVLGVEGAGKTTLLQTLGGILQPTGGTILLDGSPLPKTRNRCEQVVCTILAPDFPPEQPAITALRECKTDLPKAELEQQILALAAEFQLEAAITQPAGKLSTVQQWQCACLRAILQQPKLVLLDEPMHGLDATGRFQLRTCIRRMHAAGIACILTTDNLEDLAQTAQRILLLQQGKLLVDDTMQRLQLRLGNKRIVSLTLRAPSQLYGIPHARLVEQKSETELTLEVDISKLPMDAFLEKLGARLQIAQVSVETLSVEHIIRKLFPPT